MHLRQILLLAVGCVAVSACTSEPRNEAPPEAKVLPKVVEQCPAFDKNLVSQHTLVVNSRGDTADVNDDGDVDPINFNAQLQKIANAYVAAPDAEKSKGVLIYVNGGLNGYKQVQAQAAEQIPCMKKDGYFPIFLIWRTGAFETYGEQNNRIRDGILSPTILPTAPLYYAEDVARGLIRAPVTLWDHTLGFVKSFRAESDANYHVKVAAAAPSAGTPAKAKSSQFTRYDQSRSIGKTNNVIFYPDNIDDTVPSSLWYYIGYSATTPIRIATTPFVDSLGETGWENMVRRSRMTIRSAWEFQENFFNPEHEDILQSQSVDEDRRETLIAKYPNGTGGFSRFLQELEWCVTKAKECRGGDVAQLADAKFTLIGHSMGTIVLSDLLFLYPSLNYRDIVYMAAAASVRHVRATVVPLLEARKGETKFYSLMLHPVAEVREVTWGGVVLSGSLLEWVDDMYENPKTFADRTFGKWRNMLSTKSIFPEDAQKWMVFKVFGFRAPSDGVPADPIRHGEFNDTDKAYWRPQFWGAEGNERLHWCADKDKCN